MAAGRSGGGARAGITREDLADAVLRVLERDGPKGLSMRKVAAEVGVRAASLYWHVQNKEELLDLAFDALWEGLDLDRLSGWSAANWRDDVAELARQFGLEAAPADPILTSGAGAASASGANVTA